MTDSAEKPIRKAPRARMAATTRKRRTAGGDDRNRQPRGDRRRQQILDAAVELFAAKGYRGTGVAALAERVGMTATGMLYYFGSKERLLQEVVAERDRRDVLGLDSLNDFFVERYETARALTRSVLEHERHEGHLRPDIDVEQIAREVMAVLMGLEIQWLFDPAKVGLAEAMETYFDRLVAELTA